MSSERSFIAGPERPVTVCWISYFPVGWLPGLPEEMRYLPRLHPATWQRVLLNELKPVKGLRLHVVVAQTQFARSHRFEMDNVVFHCLKVPKGMRSLSLFWWETLLIRRCLREVQPDLVHAWGTERGAALVASRLPHPYLVTMQGLLRWIAERVRLGLMHQVDMRLEPYALRRASVVTTESKFGAGWIREHYPHLEVRPVEHAPDWVFHQVKRQPRTEPVEFLFVGTMSPIKGTDLLLAALDQLKQELDFRLTIVGAGSPAYLEELKGGTSSELWKRVDVRHNLTPAEVADILARATIMLFPTRVDNSPNSVKEAVVAGLPVVASAIGGIVDYVVPGRNGVTFPAGDLEAFKGAVRTALAHPLFREGRVEPETLAQMREYLSPRIMGREFVAAYERVLERATVK